MNIKSLTYLFILNFVLLVSCNSAADPKSNNHTHDEFEVQKSEAEWKKILTPEQFQVLRKHDTERAFSGKYNDHKKEGIYLCAGCGNKIFSSETKFESGTGWPSFYAPISEKVIGTTIDKKFGMERVEVHCGRCGGHLGHVFNDGPKPTGLRYCLNSVALDFQAQ